MIIEKVKIGWFAMWKKINYCYPSWLELIPFLLFTFVFAYTALRYAQLPGKIPTHFNFSGLPDDWKTKGFWSVYLGPVIGAAVWFSMEIMNYFFIIKPDDPGKYINLTKQQKEKLGPEQLESIRKFTARGMIMINITLAALITVLQYGAINTAMGLQKGLGFTVSIFAGALFIESIWLTFKTISMTSTLKTSK